LQSLILKLSYPNFNKKKHLSDIRFKILLSENRVSDSLEISDWVADTRFFTLFINI